MLSALENNITINAIDANKGINYTCPCCGENVILKKGNIKIHHFSHSKNSNCNYNIWCEKENESDEHKKQKLDIYNTLKLEGMKNIILEYWLGDCRPDIYFENFDGKKCAIEIQKSEISEELLIQRTQKINNHDIAVLWIPEISTIKEHFNSYLEFNSLQISILKMYDSLYIFNNDEGLEKLTFENSSTNYKKVINHTKLKFNELGCPWKMKEDGTSIYILNYNLKKEIIENDIEDNDDDNDNEKNPDSFYDNIALEHIKEYNKIDNFLERQLISFSSYYIDKHRMMSHDVSGLFVNNKPFDFFYTDYNGNNCIIIHNINDYSSKDIQEITNNLTYNGIYILWLFEESVINKGLNTASTEIKKFYYNKIFSYEDGILYARKYSGNSFIKKKEINFYNLKPTKISTYKGTFLTLDTYMM
jgi:competence CoiA-like predicted nuclease